MDNNGTKYAGNRKPGKYQKSAEFNALAKKVGTIPILLALITLEPEVEIYLNKDARTPLSEEDVRDMYDEVKSGSYRRIPNNLCIRNPFRNDHNLGSCIVDRRKNTWTDYNWSVGACNHTIVDFEERFFRFWDDSWDEWPASEAIKLIKEKMSSAEIAAIIAKSMPNSPYAKKVGVEKLKRDTCIAYKDGVYSLAYRFNLITAEEYERFVSKKPDSSPRVFSGYDEVKVEKATKGQSRPQPPIASPFVVHLTLTALAEVRHRALTRDQLFELNRNRGLYETEDYFAFPRRGEGFQVCQEIQRWTASWFAQKAYKKKVSDLTPEEKVKLSSSKLVQLFQKEVENVPGFYRDVRGTLLMSERPSGGIGILYHNDKGLANGVQIRKSDKDNGPKYAWLSSAWTLSYPSYKGGASSGTPCGYLENRNPNINPKICITEGRFKAEKIADTLGDAIFVSGVSTWEKGGVIDMIERVKGIRNEVYIMFDADLMSNTSVHGNLVNLARAISEQGMVPYMIIWPKSRGKGYDDLLQSCGTARYAAYLKTMKFEEFEDAYQKIIDALMTRAGITTLTGQSKEFMDKFSRKTQACLETHFKLKKD